MKLLILIVSLATVYGLPEEQDDNWAHLKAMLPPEVSLKAEQVGLAQSKVFQESVIKKLNLQVISDTQAIHARQKILKEYIDCSCPSCPEEEGGNKTSATRSKSRQITLSSLLNPFNIFTVPQQIITKIFQGCETKMVIETIKLLRINLLEVQLKAQTITALVSCNCPDSQRCRKILDPLIFSIVTGQNDTELERAYWAKELDGVVPGLQRGLFDRLSDAAANIISYFYQSNRPSQAQQLSSPPPTIFAPGADPNEWAKRPAAGCPTVQVNISPDAATSVKVNRTTSN